VVPVRPELVGFDAKPYRHRLGLRSVPVVEWLDRDEAATFDLAEKQRRLATDPERVLFRGPPDVEGVVAAAFGTDDLLDGASSVQEDVVVLHRGPDAWRFVAGLVCFPSSWEPREKVGLPVLSIHDPVPGYADEIGVAVDRFLDRLDVDDVRWRRNWSLTTVPDLWLAPGRPEAPVSDVGRDVWLRIERQTFRRLGPDVIVFGIRIHLWPLGEALDPRSAAGLAHKIRTASPAFRAYKEMLATHTDQLLAWLDDRASDA
jgi:hypothetical protein